MKSKKPRALVPFNTGTRVHPASKGKGSYDRKVIDHDAFVMDSPTAEELGTAMEEVLEDYGKRKAEELGLRYEHGVFHDDAGCDNHIPGHE